MIDSISTLSVQSVALRSSPQSNTDSSAQVAATNPANFVTSRIRVDNLQNIAILEYRSSEGAVVRQYPTQAQIQAFKRAAHLAAEHRQEATGFGGHQGGESHAAAPAASSNPAPQPSTAEIVQAASTYTPTGGSGGGDTGGSTQSIEV